MPKEYDRSALIDFYNRKEYEKAIDLAAYLTNKHPDFILGWKVLSASLKFCGRLSESIVAAKKAVTKSNGDYEALNNLGSLLIESGDPEKAIKSIRKSIKLYKNNPASHLNLGLAYLKTNQHLKAEREFLASISIKPELSEAHMNLGVVYRELGHLSKAIRAYNKAIEQNRKYNEAFFNLGIAYNHLGENNLAELFYNKALDLKPDFFDAYHNLLVLISGFAYEPEKYLVNAKRYRESISSHVSKQYEEWNLESSAKPLRVGFVSGDFRNHPVGYFLEGMLSHLSKFDLEIYAYSTNSKTDSLTSRIKTHFSKWSSLVGLSDLEAAERIHSDSIQVLFDLSGHTAFNRLSVFAYKPAPIQITWLGYWASTGVPEVDYILGDRFITPYEDDSRYVESIVHMPNSYLCYTQPEFNIDILPPPILDNGYVTFGCFNKVERLNEQVCSTWSKILLAIPNSKLYLKDRYLTDPTMASKILQKFESLGIKKARIVLEGSSARSEYFKSYNNIDITLSPFPYGGGTTSADSLWMGVPVLVMGGDSFLSRIGESIAYNSGLGDWVAFDKKDYIRKAIESAHDLDRLISLRAELRSNLLKSKLMDAEKFASDFSYVVQSLWENYD